MSPATLTPAIAEKLDSIESSGEENYREIVLKIAASEDVDASQLREALHGSNHTRADLERHVALAQSRIQAIEDLTHSKEIELTLPTLEQASKKANGELKVLRQKQRDELAPLLQAQGDAHAAHESAKSESRQLHVEAIQLLSKTVSANYTDEFGRLSNAMHEVRQKLDDFERKLPKLRSEIEDVTSVRDHHQGTLERIAGANNRMANSHRAEHENGLRQAEEKLELLQRKLQSGLDLEGKYHAARESLEQHEAQEFYDWRNMKFDS